MKTPVIIVAVTAVLCAGLLHWGRRPIPHPTPSAPVALADPQHTVSPAAALRERSALAAARRQQPSATPAAKPRAATPRASQFLLDPPNNTGGGPRPVDVPVEDEPLVPLPDARQALGLVGQDPDAEDVWFLAINDPALPPEARKDLIEDLNEDGFPDPKNITPDDLPLILTRLELIESIADDAMDETNAEAFAEAYKDLVNMLIKLHTPPEPEP